MKFLPTDNAMFRTQLSADQALKRLSENLEPRQFFYLEVNRSGKSFEGYIENNEFNINKVVRFSQNFLTPLIIGSINEDETGTIIDVKIKIRRFAQITIVFLLCIYIIVGILKVLFAFKSGNFFSLFRLILPILLYILAIKGFKYASTRTKKRLAELFEAEIETP